MINRSMRVLVLFDLPVTSKKDRRAYTVFRRFLIGDGLQVTEKQYNAMLIMVGDRTATEDFLTPKDFIEI